MALDITNSAAALVPGVVMPTDTLTKVRVLRGFYWDGKALVKGQVLTMPTRFAREMCSLNKAEVYIEPPVEQPAEAVKAPTPTLMKMQGALEVASPATTEPKRSRRKEGDANG